MQAARNSFFTVFLFIILALPLPAFANHGVNLSGLDTLLYTIIAGVALNLLLSIVNLFAKNLVLRIITIMLTLPYVAIVSLIAYFDIDVAAIPAAIAIVECILIYFSIRKEKAVATESTLEGLVTEESE